MQKYKTAFVSSNFKNNESSKNVLNDSKFGTKTKIIGNSQTHNNNPFINVRKLTTTLNPKKKDSKDIDKHDIHVILLAYWAYLSQSCPTNRSKKVIVDDIP